MSNANADNRLDTPGGRIAALRKKQHMTQQEIAEELDVHPQTVSKWERGEQELTLKHLDGLARRLGTTLDYLVRGESGQDGINEIAALRLAATFMEEKAAGARAEAKRLSTLSAESEERKRLGAIVAAQAVHEAESDHPGGRPPTVEPRRRAGGE